MRRKSSQSTKMKTLLRKIEELDKKIAALDNIKLEFQNKSNRYKKQAANLKVVYE